MAKCNGPTANPGWISGSATTPGPAPPPRAYAWPSFQTAAELQADPWGNYYKAVYGEIPQIGYPIDTMDNWCIHDSIVVSSKLSMIPATVGLCPTSNPPLGQRYSMNNQYSVPFMSWIWHPYPYQAMAANSWVEVMHESDPFGDEHFGAWFVYAPGSGIYFDLGTTISFATHSDAYAHFGVSSGDFNEELAKKAAGAGYDSVQFLAHVDHVNYQCDTHNTGRAGLDYLGVEVLGVKLVGTNACTTIIGAPPTIKAGWHASRSCQCDNRKQYLNCAGVPSLWKGPTLTWNTSLIV